MRVKLAATMLQLTKCTRELQAQLMRMPGDRFSTWQQACCIHKQAVLQQGSINGHVSLKHNFAAQSIQQWTGNAMTIELPAGPCSITACSCCSSRILSLRACSSCSTTCLCAAWLDSAACCKPSTCCSRLLTCQAKKQLSCWYCCRLHMQCLGDMPTSI